MPKLIQTSLPVSATFFTQLLDGSGPLWGQVLKAGGRVQIEDSLHNLLVTVRNIIVVS